MTKKSQDDKEAKTATINPGPVSAGSLGSQQIPGEQANHRQVTDSDLHRYLRA